MISKEEKKTKLTDIQPEKYCADTQIKYANRYRFTSLYAVFLSAISSICDWKLNFFLEVSLNFQSFSVFDVRIYFMRG
jgi:hypothetical protein